MSHVWSPAPTVLALASDAVHVWRVPLTLPATSIQSLQRLLSPDELDRAARFHFETDRRRFMIARGVLRGILSRYLGLEPCQLRFCYSHYGKPALAPACGPGQLRFNLSHAHELALYAITCDREVGIDVEYLRTNFAYEEVAARFFSARENATLRTLPPHLRYQAFFTCWTRKEAYIKAHGEGLSLPLEQFDVSLTPGAPAALLATRHNPLEASRWSLQDLQPGSGYVAALAAEGHGWRLACWQWAA